MSVLTDQANNEECFQTAATLATISSTTMSMFQRVCPPPVEVFKNYIKAVAEAISTSLNTAGWAVIDNFAGPAFSEKVQKEAFALYQKGAFISGHVVEPPKGPDAKTVRSDKILWLDFPVASGESSGLRQITRLIDTLMSYMNEKELLQSVKISRRSKVNWATLP